MSVGVLLEGVEPRARQVRALVTGSSEHAGSWRDVVGVEVGGATLWLDDEDGYSSRALQRGVSVKDLLEVRQVSVADAVGRAIEG